MMINGSGYDNYIRNASFAPVSGPVSGTGSASVPATAPKPDPAVHARTGATGDAEASKISPYAVTNEAEAREAGLSEGQIRGLKKSGQIECATCASRMYQDGSDENVSFKSAAHVSPNAAGAAVRSHEGEHVSNAYKKAFMNNGKVLRASVSIHMSICPECGRSYVSGGTTSTSIVYFGDNNDAGSSRLSMDEAAGIKGRYMDERV